MKNVWSETATAISKVKGRGYDVNVLALRTRLALLLCYVACLSLSFSFSFPDKHESNQKEKKKIAAISMRTKCMASLLLLLLLMLLLLILSFSSIALLLLLLLSATATTTTTTTTTTCPGFCLFLGEAWHDGDNVDDCVQPFSWNKIGRHPTLQTILKLMIIHACVGQILQKWIFKNIFIGKPVAKTRVSKTGSIQPYPWCKFGQHPTLLTTEFWTASNLTHYTNLERI